MEKFIKIEKLVQDNGTYDYKGLNIDLFVPNSQIYLEKEGNSDFYGKTYGAVTNLETVSKTIRTPKEVEVLNDDSGEYEMQTIFETETIYEYVETPLEGVEEITEDEYLEVKQRHQEWLDALPKPFDAETEVEKLRKSQLETDNLLMEIMLGGGF